MPDVLGGRAKLGVLVPSTNTVVEAEYVQMAPEGVTIHAGRIYIGRPQLHSDAATSDLLDDVCRGVPSAVRDVVTLEPDAIVMAMSAPTFYGGLAGCLAYEQSIVAQAGGQIPVVSGPRALLDGLMALGVTRIAILSPYQPVNDREVIDFFEGQGIEITRYHGLRSETATAIARTSPDDVRDLLKVLAETGPEAIVQVGTNLPMVTMADEAERWLGMPVLAINAVTVWSVLRRLGIDDRVRGCGALLRDY
jgi:maleate isomerase